MLGGACIAAGLVSFELIAYHFAKTGNGEPGMDPNLLLTGDGDKRRRGPDFWQAL